MSRKEIKQLRRVELLGLKINLETKFEGVTVTSEEYPTLFSTLISYSGASVNEEGWQSFYVVETINPETYGLAATDATAYGLACIDSDIKGWMNGFDEVFENIEELTKYLFRVFDEVQSLRSHKN